MRRFSEFVNVLHLTDLHFRSTNAGDDSVNRLLALNSLFRRLDAIVTEGRVAIESGNDIEDWRPRLIVISGDIAYSGKGDDYAVAAEFLERLLRVFTLRGNDVVLCPGNHDRDVSNIGGLTYPKSSDQADQWLSPNDLGWSKGEAPKALLAPFRDFVEFCKAQDVLCPDGIAGLEYLTGVAKKEFDGHTLKIVVLNSAWFACPGGGDLRRLWLGLPLIQQLQASGLVDETIATTDGDICMGVVHHPREWLNEEEQDTYSDRPNTMRYISERCDLILQGHVHGALEAPSLAYGKAQVFTGGATYSGGRYRNNFSILQINFDDMSVRRRGFEYDPRVERWEESNTARGVHPLGASPADLRVATKAVDLSGDWDSVFWAEGDPDLRKPVHRMSFVRVPESDNCFRGTCQGAVQYNIDGAIRGGIFSGIWDSSTTKKNRHGVFQLRMAPPGDCLTGRWLGFDRHNHIRVGYWKFVRVVI